MKKRTRIIIVAAVVVVLGGLSFPLINLLAGLPVSQALASIETDDAHFNAALGPLSTKCVNCHTDEYVLPFYAKFPVAKQIIETDIHLGTQYMDMVSVFQAESGEPVSEVVLAKIEYTTEQGSMPPMRYLALHWDGGLSAQEEADILTWIRETRAANYATPGYDPALRHSVIQPLPQEHGQDPRKVALGDKLFHDKRLSKDDTLACAGCHGLDTGGTDQARFSEGVDKQMGDINAPTVFNARYQFMQFWDGRAADLEEQADGPVNNPIEMASNWPQALGKLEKDEAFVAEFTAVYPDGLSSENIIDAIATFERTLITPNSPFDKYLAGDASALNDNEKKGYELFKEHSCATCHCGLILGGQSFELMGRKADYFADIGNPHTPDFGRFNFTKDEKDRFYLKVPTLRNITLTFPYLHDGTTSDLAEVVDIMAKYEVGVSLNAADTERIVDFLKTLTGEYNGKPLT